MPKRRRFAWEAYNPRTGNNDSGVFLAYDPATVEAFLVRRGLDDVLVQPVPRRATRGAGQPAAWELDKTELSRACAALCVTWPVEIRRTTARGRGGRHLMTRDDYGKRHRITVDKLDDAVKASQSILHELTHAAQSEAAGSWEAWLARHRIERRIPYRYRPIEVEARASANLPYKCAR
jgi:hypothetical protein